MPRGKPKPRPAFALPEIEVGDWHGEFAGPPVHPVATSVSTYSQGRPSWS